MNQAFIIMQIGIPELDKVCETTIVPAIKACGLDPKRVDKHNEGRLLKSEIVQFIQTSVIIVADLTNERPNCYLEVGYAMGLDKFRNLILTAREDHNQDSPNYKKGAKIHFDLSGYDILFWHPNNLPAFQTELEKRIKRRLMIIKPSESASAFKWNEEWIANHQEQAFKGLYKTGKTGYMEVRMTLLNHNIDIPQNDLLSAAASSQIHTFGWPIGIVGRDDFRPIPKTDGILLDVDSVDFHDKKRYDYWTLKKDGTFYLLKTLFEDYRKPGYLFFNTRIVRITEVLLHAIRLYSALKVRNDVRVAIGIRHGGLKDRILGASATGRVFLQPRKSSENEVYAEIETTLEELESKLSDFVGELVYPLFMVFEYFEIDKEELIRIVDYYVAGKVV